MDSPFFRSNWNQPSRPHHSQNARGIPVQPARRPSSSSPKVVSIPVHFMRSETTRSASALKIQKVFRGFLVRKSVKRIASIRREVEEVERRIWQRETFELIWRDAKERLRVNETLMALLLKLDSVRGVDAGVRDCRKAVIKKAIALQEIVDDIASGNQTARNVIDKDESNVLPQVVDQTLEIEDSAEQTLEIDDNQASEIKQSFEVLVDFEAPDAKDADYEAVVESGEIHCHDAPAHDSGKAEAIAEAKDDVFEEPASEICEKMDITEVNADEDDCVVKLIVVDQNPTLPSPIPYCVNPQIFTESGDENTSERQEDEETEVNLKLKDCVGAEEGDCNKKLMERVMEDNEKMRSLMTQLVERNEIQTRMLSSLTQRVEQLERAFICDRLRRKKKKRNATGTVNGSDSTPDQKQ